MIWIGSIVWGVQDVPRAVKFWCEALDYEPMEDPSPDWAKLGPKNGKSGFQLSLKEISSPKARRHHMDLFSDDREAEVERLVRLGAHKVINWIYDEESDYTVLEDPDGNRFCVVQK